MNGVSRTPSALRPCRIVSPAFLADGADSRTPADAVEKSAMRVDEGLRTTTRDVLPLDEDAGQRLSRQLADLRRATALLDEDLTVPWLAARPAKPALMPVLLPIIAVPKPFDVLSSGVESRAWLHLPGVRHAFMPRPTPAISQRSMPSPVAHLGYPQVALSLSARPLPASHTRPWRAAISTIGSGLAYVTAGRKRTAFLSLTMLSDSFHLGLTRLWHGIHDARGVAARGMGKEQI
jgi:hypothetical protein